MCSKAAYGERFLKPKHHWQLDVPAQLVRDGMVFDAFVIERTHLKVKRVANHVENLRTFEVSVLASLSTAEWNQAAVDRPTGLLGSVAALPGLDDVWVADRMEVYSTEISVNDVVYNDQEAGYVKACCSNGLILLAFVEPLVFIQAMSHHSQVVRFSGELVVWPATSLQLAAAWRRVHESLVVLR